MGTAWAFGVGVVAGTMIVVSPLPVGAVVAVGAATAADFVGSGALVAVGARVGAFVGDFVAVGGRVVAVAVGMLVAVAVGDMLVAVAALVAVAVGAVGLTLPPVCVGPEHAASVSVSTASAIMRRCGRLPARSIAAICT